MRKVTWRANRYEEAAASFEAIERESASVLSVPEAPLPLARTASREEAELVVERLAELGSQR